MWAKYYKILLIFLTLSWHNVIVSWSVIHHESGWHPQKCSILRLYLHREADSQVLHWEVSLADFSKQLEMSEPRGPLSGWHPAWESHGFLVQIVFRADNNNTLNGVASSSEPLHQILPSVAGQLIPSHVGGLVVDQIEGGWHLGVGPPHPASLVLKPDGLDEVLLRVGDEHAEAGVPPQPWLEGDDTLGGEVGAAGELGLFMHDKRLIGRADRIVSLYNCQQRLQDTDVSVHWMGRLPDKEGETSWAPRDLIVNPEVLLSRQEDRGDLETPGVDRPPHSVSLTEQTSQYSTLVVGRGERSEHIREYWVLTGHLIEREPGPPVVMITRWTPPMFSARISSVIVSTSRPTSLPSVWASWYLPGMVSATRSRASSVSSSRWFSTLLSLLNDTMAMGVLVGRSYLMSFWTALFTHFQLSLIPMDAEVSIARTYLTCGSEISLISGAMALSGSLSVFTSLLSGCSPMTSW